MSPGADGRRWRSQIVLTAALIVAVGLVVGCSGIGATQVPSAGGSGAASGGASSGAIQLAGTSWTVVSMADVQIDPAIRPTMAFGADGAVSGSDGCNTYNGTYTLTGSTLTVGQVVTTKKACGSDASSVEQTFLSYLSTPMTVSTNAQAQLVLTSGRDTIVATPM